MAAPWRTLTLAALRGLPQHALSRAAGRFAALKLPSVLQRAEIRLFGAAAGVAFDDVRDPIESFPSLQAFFTRALRDGIRPVDPAPSAVVSPCDGAWGMAGEIEGHTLLQIKGWPYSLRALLGGRTESEPFEAGSYATFYLSPRDYHRFHLPCDARVERAVHLPGDLWPVNRVGLEGIEGLFARNERICVHLEVGSGALCIVAVGATLVGKVRLVFDDLTTNARRREPTYRSYKDLSFEKGDEVGRFEFGSSLVVLASPGLLDLEPGEPGSPVRLGARIGTLRAG